MPTIPLASLMELTLVHAAKCRARGEVTDNDWAVYTHTWQTAAPRLAIRVCDCEECRASHGHLHYTSFELGGASAH